MEGGSGPVEPLPPPERAGLIAWIATSDHKRLALRLGAVALGFFVLAGLFALVVRMELFDPGQQIVGRDAYNQMFTMHGSTMVYLVVTPLLLAIGLYMVPLQIGAAGIASPRTALFGHWLIIAGGLTMFASFLSDQGAGKAGWTAYVPLAGSSATPGSGQDLWTIGVILATIGAIILAGTLLATIIRYRAPGMTMLRLPIFTWTMLFTSLMIVMSLPVLVVAMALLFADRHVGGVFDSAGGPIAYQHLFWFYGHPVVYIMFFPFLGITAEVIATFSRKRYFGYKATVLALLTFTALSMSVWAHHMFVTGQITNQYFSFTSHLLAVPAGVEYLAAIATMIGGAILIRTPLLFVLGFLLMFLLGGLTGVMLGSPPLNYHVHDSYFVVGHFHYTLFAGSMFAAFGGIYYWFPKVTGAMLRESLGRVHFVIMLIGTNLTFFPMLILGYDGMPRRVADYAADAGFTTLNRISTIGSFLIAISILVFFYNLVISLRNREPSGDDPWEGHSLEWATSSPPPRYNFTSLPPIRSFTPVFDQRHGRNVDDDDRKQQEVVTDE